MTKKTLPKAIVLKKSKVFRQIMQNGNIIHSEYFTVFYLPSSELKIGFAVSSKVKKKPRRNRLKRMTREGVRTYFREMSVHAQIIFIAKQNIFSTNHIFVFKEIEQHFHEIEKRLLYSRVG